MAGIVGIEVNEGDNPPPGAGRIIAAQAISTDDGSMNLWLVTPFDRESYSTAVTTNYTYRPATSNIQYTATETLWRAWTTNAYSVATGSVVGVSWITNIATVVTGTVWSAATGLSNLTHTVTNIVALTNTVPLVRTGIASNLLAQAWGEKPTVGGWPTNEVLYTSQSTARTLTSNIVYQVVDTVEVSTNRTRSVTRYAYTNELWTAQMGQEMMTNTLNTAIFPGDFIVGGGEVFNGGRVMLLLER